METIILQFILTKGIGEAILRRFLFLTEQMDDNQSMEVFNDSQVLAKTLGIRDDQAVAFLASRDKASELFRKLQSCQIELLWIGNANYPNRLKIFAKNEMPPLLFCQGNIDFLRNPSVGFWGSRKSSEKRLNVTRQCVFQLVEKGVSNSSEIITSN